MLKRNVLASFTSLLLLPVTIVPRTVGAVGGALMTGGSAAVQGIAMLNPQRWGGGGGGGGTGGTAPGATYSKNLEKQNGMLFEVDEEEEDYVPAIKGTTPDKSSAFSLPFSPFFSSINICIGRLRSLAHPA
jgi:recyclin-1